MLRLFAGIEIGPPVLARVTEVLRLLRPTAALRWSRDENLHITTKFIGTWPEDRAETLIETLREVHFPAAFEISVGGIDFFPNPSTPRVLIARVGISEPLSDLASRTEEATQSLRIAREERPYTPHITLARIRRGTRIESLRDGIARQPSQLGTFHVREFHLYQSANGIYTKLAVFPVN